MKRTIVALVLMMLAVLSLFSAKIEYEALPESGLSEKLTIVLDLGPDSPVVLPGVEIGFSGNEINDINDEVEIINGQRFDLTLDESSTYASASDDIYVYWKIHGNRNIRANLQIDSPLRNENGDYLDWSAGVDGSDRKVGMDTYYDDVLAFIPQDHIRAANPVAGSRELEIVTEELNDGNVVPGEYIGELKLNIAIN